MFKDTGSLGKIKELSAIVVYLAEDKQRESRDSRKDRQRETNRERIAQGKKIVPLCH